MIGQIFSSLYSMLPESKEYLTRSGLSEAAAAYILTGLFVLGVIVLHVFSAVVHRYIPSHIVDCSHTHEHHGGDLESGNKQQNNKGHDSRAANGQTNWTTERTPLLATSENLDRLPARTTRSTGQIRPRVHHRESLRQRLGRQFTQFLRGTKPFCEDDASGPCYGVSQTCGRECAKILDTAGVVPATPALTAPLPRVSREPETTQTNRDRTPDTPLTVRHVPIGPVDDLTRPLVGQQQAPDYFSQPISQMHAEDEDGATAQGSENSSESSNSVAKPSDPEQPGQQQQQQHHHHVPQNAFLSIGLQTALAIALHKLPEGFITYATNHASPALGLTVFLALFIHNITDGFALALPLFLALRSRARAIFWASLLGGISQPMGAGIAALWIWYTGESNNSSIGTDKDDADDGTSWGVYGGMFAFTAGVMTTVGLQLFSEGISLSHSHRLCIASAVVGMGILGISFALTAS